MLKVVVVGYGEMFASLIGGALLAKHEVAGALRYDRIKYSKFTLFFKDIFAPSRDYSFLKSHNIKDINAKSVNSAEFRNFVSKLGADVILVGSWGEKFSNETIKSPKIACINCHPSLLPLHRGANPYFWVINNGEKKTGITFHLMTDEFDKGDILFQGAIDIKPYMNALDLKLKCCKVAEIMTTELLDDLENKRLIPAKQDETKATYEKQITHKDLVLDFNKTIYEIENKIRAITPYFKPHVEFGDRCFEVKNYKILPESEFLKNFKAGEVVIRKNSVIVIKCADGAIEMERY